MTQLIIIAYYDLIIELSRRKHTGSGESVEDCGFQEEDTSWLISVLRDTP
jgi:hypothetical protein